MVKLFANSEDPDQTPRSAASDLGLHCLSITLLGVSRLQWVNLRNKKIYIIGICESKIRQERENSNHPGKSYSRVRDFVIYVHPHRLLYIDSVSGQRRPWPDCADV